MRCNPGKNVWIIRNNKISNSFVSRIKLISIQRSSGKVTAIRTSGARKWNAFVILVNMTRFTLIYERGDQPSNVEPRRRYDDIRLLGVLFGFHYMHRQTPPPSSGSPSSCTSPVSTRWAIRNEIITQRAEIFFSWRNENINSLNSSLWLIPTFRNLLIGHTAQFPLSSANPQFLDTINLILAATNRANTKEIRSVRSAAKNSTG